MGRLLTLEDLQAQFDIAREKLSLDRRKILDSTPLPEDFCRDSYGFSYLRAERVGLGVIMDSLKEIAWLPMQLDPQAEVLLENKNAIKKWLCSAARAQPDSTAFGNDFIHALTRVALVHGWESPEFRVTAVRVGALFHDLSCLIGLIYYGVWMAENGIMGVPVTNPYDLTLTAREISDLTRSPEVARLLLQHKEAAARKHSGKKKGVPSLHVIENADWHGNAPSPVT
jgi:hypothetical protein